MSIGDVLGEPWASLGVRTLRDEELLAKSSGLISKPDSLNYRNWTPTPGGLFDVEVFAEFEEPTALRAAGLGEQWGVTPATSRFGHIELARPIVHPFYATHGLAQLAGAASLSEADTRKVVDQHLVLVDGELVPMSETVEPAAAIYGAAVFAERLDAPLDFLVKRVLVAPVGTRPMVQLPNGGWVTSNVNDLYRRVVYRNNRLIRLLELDAPAIINMNEQLKVEEAVRHLAFNGFPGLEVITGPEREPLSSLFELAQRDAAHVPEALDGTGPARGVRALRAFEAIGFAIGT